MQSWESGSRMPDSHRRAPSSTQKRIWEAVHSIAWGGLSLLPHPARIWEAPSCGEGELLHQTLVQCGTAVIL